MKIEECEANEIFNEYKQECQIDYKQYIHCHSLENEMQSFINPFDCHKFYECYRNKGDNQTVRIAFKECPFDIRGRQLVWDSNENTCVLQNKDKPCHNKKLPLPINWSKYIQCEKAGHFQNPYDCRKYYQCKYVNGDPKIMEITFDECPIDYEDRQLIWSNEQKKCIIQKVSDKCIERSLDDNYIYGKTIEMNSTTNPRIITTSSHLYKKRLNEEKLIENSFKETDNHLEKIFVNTIECKTEGFFRNPYNCQKIFRCFYSNKNEVLMDIEFYSCTNGLVFDNGLKKCMFGFETEKCLNEQIPGNNFYTINFKN